MSIDDIINALSEYTLLILAAFVLMPLIAYGYGKLVGRDNGKESPYKYIYTFLIYLTSVPGMFSSVLVAYGLFILRSNLLKVDMVVYFVPLISMIATLVIIGRNVNFDDIPGFDRLYSFFIVLIIAFSVTFFILQMRIWILFHSPLMTLVILAVVIFVILHASAMKVFGKKRDKFDIHIPDIDDMAKKG